MLFDPEIASIRFGTGLSPRHAPPQSVDAIFAELLAPDALAHKYPIDSFENLMRRSRDIQRHRSISRKYLGTDRGKEATANYRELRRTTRKQHTSWFNATLARYMDAPHGFRERLVRFWADHFTAVGKGQYYRYSATPYVEEAIRPNINGRFADILKSASLHPMMLSYLDQNDSVGPNSSYGKKKRLRGLNENLAREILELHSLGVSGSYSQSDVREFAELLTGLLYTMKKGFHFMPLRAEPGTETVLGKTYSGPRSSLTSIHQALEDIAAHPDTAAHISRKLVTHFVSDTPDEVLVQHVSNAYLQSGGELVACYRAMLSHPLAWGKTYKKIRQPYDFIASSVRALGVDPQTITALSEKATNLSFLTPLSNMGQPWERAAGPDGWPEEGNTWITPQGIAGRIQWAMMVPQTFENASSPASTHPLDLAQVALGKQLSPSVKFAAEAAETKWEGVGLVLASPPFQKR